MLLERLGTGMVALWRHGCEAAWTLQRGDWAVQHGRVGYGKGRPEPAATLGLGVQRM